MLINRNVPGNKFVVWPAHPVILLEFLVPVYLAETPGGKVSTII